MGSTIVLRSNSSTKRQNAISSTSFFDNFDDDAARKTNSIEDRRRSMDAREMNKAPEKLFIDVYNDDQDTKH